MSRLVIVLGLLSGAGALAQAAPDEQWVKPPPESTSTATSPRPNTSLPLPGPPAAAPKTASPPLIGVPMASPPANAGDPPAGQPVRPIGPPAVAPFAVQRSRLLETPNTVSMFGAPALGQWKRGQSLVLGFPLLGVRLSIGLLERLDVGVGFDSMYGSLNEPRLAAKYEFGGSESWRLAGSLETGIAFFTQRASREVNGARWITGRRNYNVSPGLILSYQGPRPRAARLFFEVRYWVAFDTEPFATDPLNGVPASLIIGHNGGARSGAEIPLSERTSFVFALGLDVHGRPQDARVMPTLILGLVTGL